MRGIRDLEPITEKGQKAVRGAGWGGRQAAMLICCIVAVPAIAYAIYLIAKPPTDPTVVAEKLLERAKVNLESSGKSMSLDNSFKAWTDIQTNGISIRSAVPADLTEARKQHSIHLCRLWLSLSVGCLALVLVASLAFWPQARARS